MSFSDKVCAITGAGSGIGLATAKLLSAKGATVCIADVDAKALADAEKYFLSKEPSASFLASVVDVSNRNQVEQWINEIMAQFGRLDAAANIAGVVGKDHGKKTVAELDDDEWNKIIGVNLTGTMYCLRAELQCISPKGSIVNMASIHATNGSSVSLVSDFISSTDTNPY
jgi:NAD(P)-dependent dehydrogenase (short-subunit alcohol dehydrogenase family)